MWFDYTYTRHFGRHVEERRIKVSDILIEKLCTTAVKLVIFTLALVWEVDFLTCACLLTVPRRSTLPSKKAASFKRDSGHGDQVFLAFAARFHSPSGESASPGKRQPRPMMASGIDCVLMFKVLSRIPLKRKNAEKIVHANWSYINIQLHHHAGLVWILLNQVYIKYVSSITCSEKSAHFRLGAVHVLIRIREGMAISIVVVLVKGLGETVHLS